MRNMNVAEGQKAIPVDLWIRKYNNQSHVHLYACSCRISKAYEFAQTFPNHLEATKEWEVNNELGTILHKCYSILFSRQIDSENLSPL